jgi:hypothetical protein
MCFKSPYIKRFSMIWGAENSFINTEMAISKTLLSLIQCNENKKKCTP